MKKIFFCLFALFTLTVNAQYSGCDTTVIREYWYTFSETDTVSYDTVDVTYRTCLITSTTDSIRFFISSDVIGTYTYEADEPVVLDRLYLRKDGNGVSGRDTFQGQFTIKERNAGEFELRNPLIRFKRLTTPDDITDISMGEIFMKKDANQNMISVTPDLLTINCDSDSKSTEIEKADIRITRDGTTPSSNSVLIQSEILTSISDTSTALKTLINTKASTTALNLKADTVNQTFTGTITLPSATSIGSVTNTEIGYLDNVTSSIQTQLDAKAVYPSQSGNNGKYLTTDGSNTSWATVSGGGSPGGSTGQFQINNAGSFGGVANVEAEDNNLRLKDDATVPTVSSGGVELVSQPKGNTAYINGYTANGSFTLAKHYKSMRTNFFEPVGGNSLYQVGLNIGGTGTQGTATSPTYATTNEQTKAYRLEILRTSNSSSNVAGLVNQSASYLVDKRPSFFCFSGPSTGTANSNHRWTVGYTESTSVSDVDPSTYVNCFFFGYDDTDGNIQFMHNDGSGTCTKVDMGSNFAKPTSDRASWYETQIDYTSATSCTYYIKNINTGNTASGTVTSDLPASGTFVSWRNFITVAGTSTVCGVSIGFLQTETLH